MKKRTSVIVTMGILFLFLTGCGKDKAFETGQIYSVIFRISDTVVKADEMVVKPTVTIICDDGKLEKKMNSKNQTSYQGDGITITAGWESVLWSCDTTREITDENRSNITITLGEQWTITGEGEILEKRKYASKVQIGEQIFITSPKNITLE